MKKDKTQTQTQEVQAQETLTSAEQLKEKLFSLIPQNNLSQEVTKKGKKVELYTFTYPKKTKDGVQNTTVEIRDTKAIATMLDVDMFASLGTIQQKGLSVSLGRLSKKTAEKAGFKTVVDMIAERHSNLSKNTLQKYRRIGLLFGDKSADGYLWRSFIPQSVSVSNLDVVLTLFDKLDLEALTEEQLEEKAYDFYEKYIVEDKISLLATQKVLKEQVRNIKNPPIEGKAKVVSDTEQEQEQEQAQEVMETAETKEQEEIEEVRLCISTIAEYYKNNPRVSALIMELIKATTEEEQEEQ